MRADSKGSDHHRNSSGIFPARRGLPYVLLSWLPGAACLSRAMLRHKLSTFGVCKRLSQRHRWLEMDAFIRACECVKKINGLLS